MEKYDYRSIVSLDVEYYIRDNFDPRNYECIDDAIGELVYIMWNKDSITGLSSGSYFLNRWDAEEAICHNWDLLKEAYEKLGSDDMDIFDPGMADVTIRCYLLRECVEQVLNELWDILIEEREMMELRELLGLNDIDL
mgnify:CR=1 FL=1